MKHLFFGGIHPKYNKEMSKKTVDCKAVIPKQVVIPMQQHIGVPCTPLVAVGDAVQLGQKIGDGEGLCVPVHASVSGTVTAIEERLHPTLGTCLAIVIDNDYKDTPVSNEIPQTEEEILQAIREAGIVGMGGAAFPGDVKALSAMGKIDTLIANACECEPYITADDTLLCVNPEQVLEGMLLLSNILHPDHLVLAIEDNKKEAIEKLQGLSGKYPQVEVRVLPTRYPQGAEKQLVQAVTGREVPSGQLPVAAGCAVFNVSTYAAVYRAVCLGRPLTERIVTVTGEAVREPQNLIVRIGTSMADVIEAAGGLKEETERVICGGPMMGTAQKDLNVPVVKAANSILCLKEDPNAAVDNPVCIRCGKCVQVCPMKLQPLYMYRYVNAGQLKELERLHLMDCMECGCCSFTCPGKLPLVETFRTGKKMWKEVQ